MNLTKIRRNNQLQEIIYEQLQETILYRKHSRDILNVLRQYHNMINKSTFEVIEWKNLGGTLLHCLMGRLTESQLDYFDIIHQPPEEDDEQVGEFDCIDYIFRHIIDVYNPDLTILDQESNSFLDIIKSSPDGNSPLMPWYYHEFTSTEQGRDLLNYLRYHYDRQMFIKTIKGELIATVTEKGPLSLAYLAFMNMTTTNTLEALNNRDQIQ